MKKTLWSKIGIFLLFMIGMLVMTYPFYINELNQILDQKRMSQALKKSEEEYEEIRNQWLEENAALKAGGLAPGADPFNDEAVQSFSEAYYEQHLVGKVNIPDLAIEIPLYDTTTNELLDRGATVLQGSSFPLGGESTHSIITAHRGLPNRELFTNLPKLEKGAIFILEVLDQELAYQVKEIQVVEPHETSGLKIHEGQDLVTLVTCTPYMINTHRLLVTGERIPYSRLIQEEKQRGNAYRLWKQRGILLGVILLISITIFMMIREIRQQALKKERFDLRLTVKGGEIGAKFVLFDSKGKQKVIRRNQIYQEELDRCEEIVFADLPGALYTIKCNSKWLLRVGIRRKKEGVVIVGINKKRVEASLIDGEITVKCQRC